MVAKRTLYRIIFCLSAVLQAISILQYLLKNEEVFKGNWILEYSILVGISILVTTLQYFLPHRRRHSILFPLRFLILMIAHFPARIYIGLKQMFLVAFLMDSSLLLPFPVSVIVSIVSFCSLYVMSLMSHVVGRGFPFPLLHEVIYIFVFSFFIIFLFTMFKLFYSSFELNDKQITNLNETIKKLTDTNTGFQHYLSIVEEQSVEDERNRIIREIHDSIGYTLTTIIMLATTCAEKYRANIKVDTEEVLSNIQSYAKTGLNDMRIVLRLLKVKNPTKRADLIQLQHMTRAFEKASNVSVNLEHTNLPLNFDEEISHTVFRCIQEGMVNALRHGLATKISIILFIASDELIITIQDNGKGFKDLSAGIGLKGLAERLDPIGGTFDIKSITTGVILRITIPLDSGKDDGTDTRTIG